MKRIFRFIYRCHKWFGIPLALMFISWYVSGIVMLYHQFPRLTPSTTPVGEADASQIKQLWEEVPDTFKNCKISFSGNHLLATVDNQLIRGYSPTLSDLKAIADSFGTEIEEIDTLQDIDKWIPFNRLTSHLSIYKIVGSDKSFTYISSKTGELLQHNTLSGRRWAWVGALPHYVYITPLRRDSKLWSDTVIWMSGLCTISVIFGLIIAIRFLLKTHKFKIFTRKTWNWHYSWGLFFGVGMLAFIFSGMMSLAKIPDWIIKSKPIPDTATLICKDNVDITYIPGSFGIININATPIPTIRVTKGEESAVLPINHESKLDFSPEVMSGIITVQTGEKVESIEKVEYDVFYPQDDSNGFKATTKNYTVYWNTEGYYRIMTVKSKAQAICYRVLHTMNLPIINRVKWVHELFMWILLLGGLVIVGTGTILSVKYVSKLPINKTKKNH